MKPDEWPAGATEEFVRDCNCHWCESLIDQLENLRAEQSNDGEHKPLNVYSGG